VKTSRVSPNSVCNQLLGDYFGSVYWTIRSLAAFEVANSREQLLKNYDCIRENWEKHQGLESVSDQPRWYITFCLSLLRLHGILFSRINTENLENLLGVCLENLSTFLKQTGDLNSLRNQVNLLTYMVHMWVFIVHHCVHDYKSLGALLQGDSSDLFSASALEQNDFGPLSVGFFARFIEKLASSVSGPESPWLGPLLVFLYWLSSYRNLPRLFFSAHPKLKSALFAVQIELMTGLSTLDESRLATQSLLPEDLLSLGFLPLQHYFAGHKELKGTLAEPSQEPAIRLLSANRLIDELKLDFEEHKRAIEELPIDLDDQFGLLGSMDTPGLIFKEELRNERKLVLIDGPNIAMRHGNGKFSCKGIKLALEYFLSKGFQALAVIPEQRLEEETARYLRQRQESSYPVPASKVPDAVGILKELDRQGLLVKTPPWDYDDSYCLKYAQEKEAVIVTNDRYEDHIEKEKGRRRWIREHCCSFTFAGDDFLPNPDFAMLRRANP